MCTTPEIAANTHAPAGTPPVANSSTTLAIPANMNCPHSAMNGSPARLANRFHPACRTAAVSARTVASSTVCSAGRLRRLEPFGRHRRPAADAAVLAEHVGQQPVGVLGPPGEHLLRE